MANSRKTKEAAGTALTVYEQIIESAEDKPTNVQDLITDLLLTLDEPVARTVLRRAIENYNDDVRTPETD